MGISKKSAFVYILKCVDDSYYVGSTLDFRRRLSQHQAGKGARYTRGRGPFELSYLEEFPSLGEAYKREAEIKRWRRSEKEKLIHAEENRLPQFILKEEMLEKKAESEVLG